MRRHALGPAEARELRAAVGCLKFGAYFTAEAVELLADLPGEVGEELATSVARLHDLLGQVASNLGAAAEKASSAGEGAHG